MNDPNPHSIEGGTALIAAERARQVSEEGWSAEHDDEHTEGELAIAAACYAAEPVLPKRATWEDSGRGVAPAIWPWDRKGWNPNHDEPIRDLVRAGALIAAEIDRLQRLDADAPCPTCKGNRTVPCSCLDCLGNVPHGQEIPCPDCAAALNGEDR